MGKEVPVITVKKVQKEFKFFICRTHNAVWSQININGGSWIYFKKRQFDEFVIPLDDNTSYEFTENSCGKCNKKKLLQRALEALYL